MTQGPHVGSRHPIPYAEGVEQQSMQATRQSTRKGSHNASQLWNPFGVLEAPWLHAPGCAAVRQPWALLFNAFGVGNGMTTGILTFWFHPGTRRTPASCHPRAVPLESTRAAERYICRQFEPGSEPGWRRPAAAHGQPRSLPARGFRGVYQEVKSVRTVLALLLGVALGAVVFAAAWPAAPAESAANAPPQGPAQGKIGHGLSRADCHAGRPKPSRSQAADCRSGRNALGAGRPRRRAAGEIRVH